MTTIWEQSLYNASLFAVILTITSRKHLARVSLLWPLYISKLTGMSTRKASMVFFQHKNKWKLASDHWEIGSCFLSSPLLHRMRTSRSTDQSESHDRDATQVIKHLKAAALLHNVTTHLPIIKSPIRPHLQVHYLTTSWARTIAVSTETTLFERASSKARRQELSF